MIPNKLQELYIETEILASDHDVRTNPDEGRRWVYVYTRRPDSESAAEAAYSQACAHACESSSYRTPCLQGLKAYIYMYSVNVGQAILASQGRSACLSLRRRPMAKGPIRPGRIALACSIDQINLISRLYMYTKLNYNTRVYKIV